jgi:hypothetical protein
MSYRFISRRRFIESSIGGGMAIGFGMQKAALSLDAAGASGGADGLTLRD